MVPLSDPLIGTWIREKGGKLPRVSLVHSRGALDGRWYCRFLTEETEAPTEPGLRAAKERGQRLD